MSLERARMKASWVPRCRPVRATRTSSIQPSVSARSRGGDQDGHAGDELPGGHTGDPQPQHHQYGRGERQQAEYDPDGAVGEEHQQRDEPEGRDGHQREQRRDALRFPHGGADGGDRQRGNRKQQIPQDEVDHTQHGEDPSMARPRNSNHVG